MHEHYTFQLTFKIAKQSDDRKFLGILQVANYTTFYQLKTNSYLSMTADLLEL